MSHSSVRSARPNAAELSPADRNVDELSVTDL